MTLHALLQTMMKRHAEVYFSMVRRRAACESCTRKKFARACIIQLSRVIECSTSQPYFKGKPH